MTDNIFDWSNQKENLSKVAAEGSGGFTKDERFWTLGKDKSGNGIAIIRMLPWVNEEGKAVPFIGYKLASAKRVVNDKMRWLIVKSPMSIGDPCPINETYNRLLKSGNSEGEKIAKEFLKLKMRYIGNVKVIKDPINPANDGKTFLWEFGPSVREMILNWINPSEDDKKLGTVSKNVFNPLEGYNIKIKLVKPQNGIYNYTNSEIAPEATRAIDGIDTSAKYVEWARKHLVDLNEFERRDWFPTYTEVKERLENFYPGLYALAKNPNDSAAGNVEWGGEATKKKEILKDNSSNNITTSGGNVADDETNWMD